MHFQTKSKFNDKYTVVFPIKQGANAETYRVKDSSGKRYFLKLFDRDKTHPFQFDAEGGIREIKILEEVSHAGLPQFVEKGTVTVDGVSHPMEYVVTDFLPSETLAEYIGREETLRVYETKQMILCVLEAVKYLHSLPSPIIHNEITALNVLIDLTDEGSNKVRLIDFGYARHLDEAFGQGLDGLDWFYLAPERFEGRSTQQSDIYAVGALAYQMLFGIQPWYTDLSRVSPEKRMPYLLHLKRKPLMMPNIDKYELDGRLLNVLRKALAYRMEDRFQSAQEMIDAINGGTFQLTEQLPDNDTETFEQEGEENHISEESVSHPRGNGFADVAGMTELKQMLTSRVLSILKDTEKARRYRLQIPNGILFYGPPGCGKSFLAEKFAEEAGYNFKLVKASDLASIYVHGSQEKIGALFDEARKNAPSILCFDEFDALVPARGKTGTEHQSGEVNEFLTQLNNCGEQGVFVIASTNRPDMIDPAVLRRGRIDKVIYIPMPDEESRGAMFELHMKGRPYDSNIDYKRLAQLTENYIASDIAYVVNEAAARAAFADVKISQQHLEEVISESSPSLNASTINEYKRLREKMEGVVEQRRRVGF